MKPYPYSDLDLETCAAIGRDFALVLDADAQEAKPLYLRVNALDKGWLFAEEQTELGLDPA